jgi:tight adherence protein B
MPLSTLLALLLTLGLGLVVGGGGFLIFGLLRNRQLAILRRFSGMIRLGPDQPAGGIALRRDDAPSWWSVLFPAGVARNLPAFNAEMRRVTFVLILSVMTFVAFALRSTLGTNLLIGLVVGVIAAALIWYFWALARYRKRLFAIDEAVPEAMDLIVRTLRVGQPIGTAIQSAGRELVGPIAEEFTRTADRISYGQEPVGALRDMADRCANQSLRFFAAAVAIQSASGGNLAEVLERLSAIARGRQQMRRKVRSITAEAKWSGRFLSIFPLLAVAMLMMINPGYFSEISDKPFFMPMLAVVGTLLLLNILFMRWLVKIE